MPEMLYSVIDFLKGKPWTEPTAWWTRCTGAVHGDAVRQGTLAIGLWISG
jgi:hypothetical protein